MRVTSVTFLHVDYGCSRGKPWSLHTTVAKLGSIYCGNAENCHQGCSTTLLLATWSGYKKKDLRQKYIKSLDFFCLLLTCEWASKDQESNNGPRVKLFKVAWADSCVVIVTQGSAHATMRSTRTTLPHSIFLSNRNFQILKPGTPNFSTFQSFRTKYSDLIMKVTSFLFVLEPKSKVLD